MSFRATIEILVHLQNFRNVDLFHQGVYQMKATIHQKKLNLIRSAQPYMILEGPPKSKPQHSIFTHNLKNTQDYIIQGAKLQDIEFWSKAFIVKYCDEAIDLNDGCVFRCEIDAYPEFDSSDFYFQVELMFTELSTLTQEDYKNERLKNYMKSVSKFESKINNLFSGIKEYVPIIFDEMHFCVVKATVHSLLIDFRFRQSSDTTKQMDNFDQFLGGITNKSSEVQKDLVDEFYTIYVRSLRNTHELFHKYQQNIIGALLKDDTLKQKYKSIPQILPIPMHLKKDRNFQVSLNIPTDDEEELKDQSTTSSKEKTVSDYYQLSDKRDQQEMCNSIILEISSLSSSLFSIWYQFLEVFECTITEVMNNLEIDYVARIKDRWGESIFQNILLVQDLAQYTEQKIGRKHKEVAQQIRSNQYYQLLEPLCIEDINLFPEAKIHPILFKEVFCKQGAVMKLKPLKGVHLIIFAHGYQGNSFDMRLWKNLLSVKYPDHVLISMSSNEDDTEQDILHMGLKLADEVKKYIKEWFPKDQFAKLSFIGHSLGGLIIRAALPHLEKYRDKMQTFLTLASPHLGFLLSSSKVVDTGLWVIKKWKKCICLNQLTLTDAKSLEDTCIYKLSCCQVQTNYQLSQGLGWFRNIILVSSYQDSYSPFESARIQRSDKISQDSSKGRIYNKMIDNLLDQLQTDRVQRLDVNYEKSGQNFDNMIGRAAHIAFLDNQALVKLIIYSYDDLLC